MGVSSKVKTILRAEEDVLLDIKSGERALFEMKSDEKALLDEELKSLVD